MKLQDWKKLQNGSDIRGVALEGIVGENINLSPEVATILAKSFAIWLQRKNSEKLKVAIGTDSRLSGPSLKRAFILGLTEMGVDVLDCRIASTPAMFMTTINDNLRVAGAVMLTASHLPFNRNGMKFFTKNGGFDKIDVSDLLEIASEDASQKSKKPGSLTEIDFISDYSAFLVETIRKGVKDSDHYNEPLKGLKIIVDAGNGSGGFFADKVLIPLGADISGSQFLDPDGTFPNHVPNPEDPTAMASICDAVKREKADLGIIFDTDVDRSAIVDEFGNPINRNELIALISAVILEEHPGSTIVTDSITSEGLKWFIEKELEGIHHRFKRGYKNVINESVRLNKEGQDSWLAIETSGHAALKENYFLDDGAYLVAKLLIKMARLNKEGKTLKKLIDKLPVSKESEEFRLSLKGENFLEYGNKVIAELSRIVEGKSGWKIEKPNYEGLRVNCTKEEGWFLIRMSLHDPVMPLNIESNHTGGVQIIASEIRQVLSKFDKIDLHCLPK